MVIEPERGTIKPRSEQLIIVTFTFYRGGKIQELISCNVEDMDMPLGFLLQSNYCLSILAETFGLSVSYELCDEAMLLARSDKKSLSKTKGDLNALLPPSRYDNQSKNVTQKKKSKSPKEESKDLSLKSIDFQDSKINKISVKKFIIKNNSGIKANFALHSVNYEPARHINQNATQQNCPSSEQKPLSSSKHSLLEVSEQSNIYK